MNFKNASQPLFLSVAAAAMLLTAAPLTVRAESGVSDPGAFGIFVDPNASGTKLTSAVAFAYEYETPTPPLVCDSLRYVKNLHIVAKVQKGMTIQVFSSNYSLAGREDLRDCWDNQTNQLTFFKYFIEEVVIAGFYKCGPSLGFECPAYAVKSIKNFLSTGHGGASLDVELAVR